MKQNHYRFDTLMDKQNDDRKKEALRHLKDEFGMSEHDPIWGWLYIMEHHLDRYVDLYKRIPQQIEETKKEQTDSFKTDIEELKGMILKDIRSRISKEVANSEDEMEKTMEELQKRCVKDLMRHVKHEERKQKLHQIPLKQKIVFLSASVGLSAFVVLFFSLILVYFVHPAHMVDMFEGFFGHPWWWSG